MIEGAKTENDGVQYLHHGLALRLFARRFELADHVTIVGAKLENGLLIIDLKKEIPEEMKPRRIAITVDTGKEAASKRIDSAAASFGGRPPADTRPAVGAGATHKTERRRTNERT